jgi:hypothetical protein
VPWSFAASNIYHNWYWYPFVGKRRMERALRSEWGQLLQRVYSPDEPINAGYGSRRPFIAASVGAAAFACALGLGLLMAMRRKE